MYPFVRFTKEMLKFRKAPKLGPLDTHIYRLRNKLGLTADRGWQLLTIYGYGYRLESVTAASED